MSPFQVLAPSIRPQRRNLATAICAGIGAQFIGLTMPLIARYLINYGPALSGDSILWSTAALLVALALLRGLLMWQQSLRGERAAQGLLAHVRGRMYARLQRLSQGYFDRRPIGKILVRFAGDANSLRTWVARTVVTVPADGLTLAGVGAALGLIHPMLLLVAAGPLLILWPVFSWINPQARHWTRQGRGKQSRLCALLSERLTSGSAIKASNLQEADRVQIQAAIDQVADANVRRARWDAWADSLSVGLSTLALAAIVVWGMRLAIADELKHGDLVSAVWLVLLSRGPIHRLARANVIHQRARVAAERIALLLNRPSEPGWSEELNTYDGPGRNIELRGITYRNAAGHRLIRRLTITIQGPGLVVVRDNGERVKGILLELLLRLRRPHKGRIYLDGQDVRRLRVSDIRRRMGWVDRERSLAELIWIPAGASADGGDPSIRRQTWDRTAPIAPELAPPWEEALPRRGGQVRRGRPLSPEGRLRIAIYAALTHNPPVLLIDEPTLDLEPGVVERLTEWLRQASRDMLVILATNDLRLCAIADQEIISGRGPGPAGRPPTTPDGGPVAGVRA